MSRPSGPSVPLLATVAASVGVLGAALLPWLRTGSASRSAFGLARSAEILGLFDGWTRRACLAVWYLLPFLVATAWTAGALRRPGVVATLGGAVGLMSVIAGVVVWRTVRPEAGPVAAVSTGATAIACAAWLAYWIRRTPARAGEEGAAT